MIPFGTKYDRVRVQTAVVGPSKTRQAQKDECDINRIIDRYKRTGQVSHFNPREPLYGAFPPFKELRDALDAVDFATNEFMRLPSKLRDKFNNDGMRFFEWLETATPEQLQEVGLKTPPPVSQAAPEANGSAVSEAE